MVLTFLLHLTRDTSSEQIYWLNEATANYRHLMIHRNVSSPSCFSELKFFRGKHYFKINYTWYLLYIPYINSQVCYLHWELTLDVKLKIHSMWGSPFTVLIFNVSKHAFRLQDMNIYEQCYFGCLCGGFDEITKYLRYFVFDYKQT